MIRNLLVLPTGEELFSGVTGENAICGVTVTRCVNGETELSPGGVCAGMLEATVIAHKPLSLLAGEEVILYTVDDSGSRTQDGVFIAEKPTWESANRYTLTAYDRVSKLDKDLTDWLAGLTGWPYSLLDFAHMVCDRCDLELISGELPNGSYLVQAFSAQGITGRQLMQWIGQASGRFCRATKDGKIEFAWYAETGRVFAQEEKIQWEGPASSVCLKDMKAGTPLQAVTQIKPSLSGVKSVKLSRRGRNVLDLESAGVFHSNDYTGVRHTLNITDTGIRMDVISGRNVFDRSLWGFCLGTAKELAGKTITVSADFSTSKTGAAAIAYMGFFEVSEEPVFGKKSNFTYAGGGTIYNGTFSPLNTYSGQNVTSATYQVTGKEKMKYIAALFAICDIAKGATSAGDWTQWDNIQVEYAAEATPYQPYCCDAFTRSFSVIHGGNLDWNTGRLTVTHGKIEKYAQEAVPDGWISSTGKLTSGAQVVYPLDVPYTVSLSPQQIKTLEGDNYLWSSTGNTEAGFRQNYYFANSLHYEDYRVTPVEKVQLQRTERDVGAIWPDDPEKQNAYIITGNYLLTNGDREALETVAQTLYGELDGHCYTPCKMEIPAEAAVEAGDIVTVADKNGREITVYVMESTRSGQRIKLECTGSPRRDSVTAVNAQTYQALSGKVLELQMDIEGLRAENRDAQGNYSGLAVTVEGIAAEVTRQKTSEDHIRQQMTLFQQTAEKVTLLAQGLKDNGTDRIRTSMGYTFDDNGLRISSENADVSNLLDHSGMYVTHGDQAVLTANSEGVQAVNIQVCNYLTVGKHARFETYGQSSGEKRTACFFMEEPLW